MTGSAASLIAINVTQSISTELGGVDARPRYSAHS
jgi:hypothetical protein